MAGFENIFSSVVGTVASEASGFVCSIFTSSRDVETKIKTLQDCLLTLRTLKDDTEAEVKKKKNKVTTKSYDLWRKRVSEINAKAGNLIAEFIREPLAPSNVLQRSKLHKEMENQRDEITELLEEGRSMDFLVDKPPEPVLREFDAPPIKRYTTLQGALVNILCLLKSNKVEAIGVSGTKGVGKTAIVQNLNNNEVVAELFDIVIFIRVATDQTSNDLRQKIAKRLKVDIETVDEELKNKKYLLILDDVRKPFHLDQMGLPTNSNGSKVVITSLYDCKFNGVQRSIKVTLLSSGEAWEMFQDVAGSVINLPDVRPVAQLVCEKCSRLPILIHRIANSFKRRSCSSSWWAGLKDLKTWPELENQGLQELYSSLKFCYDELKDENKLCFLYTSLYPADSKVYSDYLIECCAAQGFLGDVNDTRRYQDARDRGNGILDHLIDVSLLEKGERRSYVKMNDCMRQLALHIISRYSGYLFYVQSSEESEKPTNLIAWERARCVSMIDSKCKLRKFEIEQDCRTLLALLLQKNSELAEFSQTDFQNMSCLTVLDLYDTGITQLPPSLSKLTALKALYLNDCKHLMELPPDVRSLQLLEVLDIRGTKISFIPSHIGYLDNLRCLRIPYIRSSNQSLAVNTDDNVISKLGRLEELIIEVMSYEQWEHWCSNAENVIQQVVSLKNLTSFGCSFPSSESLRNFVTKSITCRDTMKFTSFRFFIGCENSKRPQILNYFEYRITKYLKYFNGEQEYDLAIGEVLAQSHAFELSCHKDIMTLLHFGTKSLNCVRGILIERCNAMQTVVAGNGDDTRNQCILKDLEQLYLLTLPKLNCVFRGPFRFESFGNLQTLTIDSCPLLECVFSNGAIQHCSKLRRLVLQNCAAIKELIIVAEDYETEGNLLPNLEILELNNLPELTAICKIRTLAWSSLELLQISGCHRLKFLPFAKDKAVKLRAIKGEQQWWSELEWIDHEVRERLQRMFRA